MRCFSSGLERFRDGQPEKPDIYAFVKRACLHLSRTAWRRRHREASSEAPMATFPNPEVRTRRHGILARLSGACREVLERLYFDGWTYAEVGAELRLKESSVRARASPCLAEARRLLA